MGNAGAFGGGFYGGGRTRRHSAGGHDRAGAHSQGDPVRQGYCPGQQGDPGVRRRAYHEVGETRRGGHTAGGQRARRHLSVPRRETGIFGFLHHFDGFGRPFSGKEERRSESHNPRGGFAASQLGYGTEDYH